jgi:hypothetical protein
MPSVEVLLLIVIVVAGVIGGWIYFRGRQPPEQPYYHFRCAGCGRRLRYRARQVGHKGGCSHCGREVIFPPISEAIE